MGGCRCSYKNCQRATKNSEKEFHFFHYPIRDPDRCMKWVTNAKKVHFKELPEDQLRNKVVCQLHFETNCFTNCTKKRLVHDAVPTLDAGSEELKLEDVVLQVVQSDCDGNVYTVDTDLMQSELQNVKSYVIQNGNLIPANYDEATECCNLVADPLADPIPNALNQEQNIINYEYRDLPTNNLMEYSNKEVLNDESEVLSYQEAVFLPMPEKMVESSSESTVNGTCISIDLTSSKDVQISNPTNNHGNIENISLTIKQHSEDIERLKRVIQGRVHRRKQRRKLNSLQIINSLRGLIPPSLSAALSIHLFNKVDNFTRSEKTFLESLYQTSPDGYIHLRNSCKWKLPDIQTIERLIQVNHFH